MIQSPATILALMSNKPSEREFNRGFTLGRPAALGNKARSLIGSSPFESATDPSVRGQQQLTDGDIACEIGLATGRNAFEYCLHSFEFVKNPMMGRVIRVLLRRFLHD